MKLYVFDSETTKWGTEIDKIDFILGVFYNIDTQDSFTVWKLSEINDFIVHMLESRETYRIYCHNLDFDSKFIFPILVTLDISEIETYIVKSGGKIIEIQLFTRDSAGKKRKHISFRDSFAMLPVSVEKLGKALKLPKLEYSNKENELEIYCRRDCEIVARALEIFTLEIKKLAHFTHLSFRTELSVKTLPLTISSLAKKFLRKLNPNRWLNTKEYRIYEDLLREFYYGGRTEVFNFNLLENGVQTDYNSLYPFEFTNYRFPSKDFTIIDNSEGFTHSEIFSDDYVIAVIAIVRENDYMPFYPSRVNQKTLFCNGTKQVVIFAEEYKEVIETGLVSLEILKVEAIIIGEQNWDLKEFYLTWYDLRLKSLYPYALKIFGNGSYGKYGENREKDSSLFIPLSDEKIKSIIEDNGYVRISNDAFAIIKEKKVSEFLENNILIAMKTTAMARLTLYLGWCRIGKREIWYTDTDSQFNKELPPKDMLSSKLGGLKVEYFVKKLQAYSPKEYIVDGKSTDDNSEFKLQKFKGVNTKQQDFNVVDYYMGKGIEVSRPAKIGEIHKRNLNFDSVVNFVKHKREFYTKRIINDDLTTRPIDIDNPDDLFVIENKEKVLKILCGQV